MTFEVYTHHSVGMPPGWRWRLKAINGQIIATSGESYRNRASVLRMVRKIACQTGRGTPVEITPAPPEHQHMNAGHIPASGSLTERPKRKTKRRKR